MGHNITENTLTRFAKEIGATKFFYVGGGGGREDHRYVSTIKDRVKYTGEDGERWMVAYLNGVAYATGRTDRVSWESLEAVLAVSADPDYADAFRVGHYEASRPYGRKLLTP